MKRAAQAVLSAFAYFTAIPLGRLAAGPAPDAYALTFLPLVGAAVGAVAGIIAQIVLHAAGATWATIAALAASLLLTGSIHFDGFLDSCDGLFATAAPERRLEIMRDARHGTFAFTGGALAIVSWLAAIAGVLHAASLPLVLAFGAGAARLAAIPNAWIFPYARAGAVTRQFASRPSAAIFTLMALIVIALAWFLHESIALAIVPCAVLLALAIGWLASRRLGGGLTGDVYGFTIVVVEVSALAALHATGWR